MCLVLAYVGVALSSRAFPVESENLVVSLFQNINSNIVSISKLRKTLMKDSTIVFWIVLQQIVLVKFQSPYAISGMGSH